MRGFYLVVALAAAALPARAETEAWIQAVAAGGYGVRLVTSDSTCPMLRSDKGNVAMTVRAPANDAFPLTCEAPVPPGAIALAAGDIPLPVPAAIPNRILVLGDTGCRIKGGALQACNDPAAWPFSALADAAAKLEPDLIVHVGDYLYRESPCPAGNAGCAGSPSGDNWPSWKADFFRPAVLLRATAPLVLVRGNHEECSRAGEGFLRLMGPGHFDPGAPCDPHLAPFTVSLGDTSLAVIDDANAPDTDVDDAMVPVYAAEFEKLADFPGPVWFAAHRPIWAAISGPMNLPIGGNATLIAAAGKTLLPPNVRLMLSGHIHSFEAINYDGKLPPQIVAGNGGDNLDVTPRDLKGAIFQGHSGVRVKDGLSVGGFGFLMLTRKQSDWTIDLYDAQGNRKGRCVFTPGRDGPSGRVDCPGLAP